MTVPIPIPLPCPWSLDPSDLDPRLCLPVLLLPPPDASCPVFCPLSPTDPLSFVPRLLLPLCTLLLPAPSPYTLCPLNRGSPYLVRGVGWTRAALRASASKPETARPRQVRSAGRDAICTALPAAHAPTRDRGGRGRLLVPGVALSFGLRSPGGLLKDNEHMIVFLGGLLSVKAFP